MPANLLCDPYVWEHPSVLVRTGFFPPLQQACVSELVNQIFLVTVVVGIVAAGFWSITKSGIPLVLCGFVWAVLAGPSLASWFMTHSEVEDFQDAKGPSETPSVDVIGKGGCGVASEPVLGRTDPTARNPFMNVLIDEIKYNPGRPAAASVLDPSIKITLDDFFRTEFNRDPTDVFGRSQSQRQWTPMPSTSIPNDQESYQNWLYKIPGKTCKEGGRDACLPGTDGGALPWLNVDS